MERIKLSERLRQLRKMHSYTQDYVASYLGIIRQTYGHYESGRSMPSTETLYKIAGLYKIPVEDLLHLSINLDSDEYDIPEHSSSSQDLEKMLEYYSDDFNKQKYRFFSDQEKELLYFFNRIDDVDRREIIEFTRIKAKKYT